MNRLAGIIVAVIGLVIAVLSALKVLPSLLGTGVGLILLGGLMIGLSFVSAPAAEDAPRMTTAETLLKIFYAPAAVFQNLRRHPRWLVALLIMTLVSAVYSTAFFNRLTPERITNYTIDKTKEMPMMNDEARKGIEAGRADAIAANTNPVLRAAQVVNSFVFWTFWSAFLAAVFFLFALAMGGRINYWQAFSASVYSMFPVVVISQILNLIILFLKDPVDIHPILGQGTLVQDSLNFLATPSESPVLYSLLSMFGIFIFYQIWMRATGLKNAGERITPTIAWTTALAIWVIGIFLSVLTGFLFPSFLS